IRPLKALRNLVRLGCSISNSSAATVFAGRPDSGGLSLHHQPVLGERVMAEDLALEDPNLDPAHAVGGVSSSLGVIDVAAQRVQRHPALAVPFGPSNLGAAETAGAGDADALGAEAQRGLYRTLHRPAERDAALQLVGDALRDEAGVDFRLTDLDDVEADFRARHRAQQLLQLLDVAALLADDDTGAG